MKKRNLKVKKDRKWWDKTSKGKDKIENKDGLKKETKMKKEIMKEKKQENNASLNTRTVQYRETEQNILKKKESIRICTQQSRYEEEKRRKNEMKLGKK